MISLAAHNLDAAFDPAAGMLGVSLRHDGEELLGALGIPLLHPWANRLSREVYEAAGRVGRVPTAGFVPRDDHGLAIHGLIAPHGAWMVRGAGAATLEFPPDDDQLLAFPFPHRLDVDALLNDSRLVVRTTLTPTSTAPVPVAFGYHPYLRLPGVPRRAWRVEMPAMHHLDLDLDRIPTGRSVQWPATAGPLGDRVYDDAFTAVPPGAGFVLEGAGRRITVRFEEGYPVAQVFAPASADVVCFEPMTAPVDALVTGKGLPIVEPGDHYTASFAIEVETC